MASTATQFRRSIICGLLLTVTSFSAASNQSAVPGQAQRHALVVLIGGMDSDPTPEQIAGKSARNQGNSGLYRLQADLNAPEVVTEYFNWNGTRASHINAKPAPHAAIIAETIRQHVLQHPRDRVILVGNSWGGHTAWEVCQSLVESPTPVAIDYVIFLDPSSTGRAKQARPKHLPINVNRATNFYTRNLFGWRKWPHNDLIENIDLGDEKQGYLTPGGPAYNSAFDFSAHVAAEWDERIHQSIREKISEAIRPAQNNDTDSRITTGRSFVP